MPPPVQTEPVSPIDALRKKIDEVFYLATAMQEDLKRIEAAPPNPRAMADALTKLLTAK